MSDEDNIDTGLADQDDTQEDERDESDNSSEGSEEEQGSSETEKLYAGKFRTPEELEKSYEEIQRFVGNRKTLESKAQMYDRLVAQSANSAGQSSVSMPKLADYVLQDGSLDVVKYDVAMEKWQGEMIRSTSSISSKRAQEEADMSRIERDFPYLKEDERAARQVMALYRSGEAASIYEAGVLYNDMRSDLISSAEKRTAKVKTEELSKKVRANTESPGGRSIASIGEIDEKSFEKLSQAEKKKFIEQQFKSGKWKNF